MRLASFTLILWVLSAACEPDDLEHITLDHPVIGAIPFLEPPIQTDHFLEGYPAHVAMSGKHGWMTPL